MRVSGARCAAARRVRIGTPAWVVVIRSEGCHNEQGINGGVAAADVTARSGNRPPARAARRPTRRATCASTSASRTSATEIKTTYGAFEGAVSSLFGSVRSFRFDLHNQKRPGPGNIWETLEALTVPTASVYACGIARSQVQGHRILVIDGR